MSSRVGIIEPDGMLNGWNSKVRTTTAISRACDDDLDDLAEPALRGLLGPAWTRRALFVQAQRAPSSHLSISLMLASAAPPRVRVAPAGGLSGRVSL